MAIDKVGGRLPVVLPKENSTKVKDKKGETADVHDKIQLSEEALSLYGTEKAKKLEAIRANIQSGFYETPEVTARVVAGLLRDLKRPPHA